jgi:hypothetical protein
MVNEGAEKFKEELMGLKGQAFVISYNNALEYFQPKLNRTTLLGDEDSPLNIKATKEVIFKDMNEASSK